MNILDLLAQTIGYGFLIFGGIFLAGLAYYQLSNLAYKKLQDGRKGRAFMRWYNEVYLKDVGPPDGR